MIYEGWHDVYLGHGDVDQRYHAESTSGTTREELREFINRYPQYTLDVLEYHDPQNFDSRVCGIMRRFQAACRSVLSEVYTAPKCGSAPEGGPFKIGHLREMLNYANTPIDAFLWDEESVKIYPKCLRRRIRRLRREYDKFTELCR